MKTRIAFSFLLLAAAATSFQSLEEMEAWDKQESIMKSDLETVGRFCGVTVTHKFDRPSWSRVREQWADASPSGRCGDVADRLVDLCRSSETAKRAVAKGVKNISCAYGGKTNGFRFDIVNGNIDYAVEADRANINDEILSLLKKKL